MRPASGICSSAELGLSSRIHSQSSRTTPPTHFTRQVRPYRSDDSGDGTSGWFTAPQVLFDTAPSKDSISQDRFWPCGELHAFLSSDRDARSLNKWTTCMEVVIHRTRPRLPHEPRLQRPIVWRTCVHGRSTYNTTQFFVQALAPWTSKRVHKCSPKLFVGKFFAHVRVHEEGTVALKTLWASCTTTPLGVVSLNGLGPPSPSVQGECKYGSVFFRTETLNVGH